MRIIYALPVTGFKTWCPVLRRAAAHSWLVSYHYLQRGDLKAIVELPKEHRSQRKPRMATKQHKGFSRDGQEGHR